MNISVYEVLFLIHSVILVLLYFSPSVRITFIIYDFVTCIFTLYGCYITHWYDIIYKYHIIYGYPFISILHIISICCPYCIPTHYTISCVPVATMLFSTVFITVFHIILTITTSIIYCYFLFSKITSHTTCIVVLLFCMCSQNKIQQFSKTLHFQYQSHNDSTFNTKNKHISKIFYFYNFNLYFH